MPQPEQVPAEFRDLIDRPLLTAIATTLPNGTPQVTPVWFSTDEQGYFYVNTAVGRLKDKAIRVNPYVALMIVDPDNPYRYLAIRGPITDISEEEGRAHINLLSERYTGNPVYSFGPPDERRVRYQVCPEFISAMG